MHLVTPAVEHLPSYIAALESGWSPDNRRPEAAAEELQEVAADPVRFIAGQCDPEGKGPPLKLPDGSAVPRLPGFHRWMWDGEFCGSIGARWQPGTEELPPHCLGHIGYSVVPGKRRRGYATRALGLLLPELRPLGLRYVELTTESSNAWSQRVIEANGGVRVGTFSKPDAHGGAESLRFRIML